MGIPRSAAALALLTAAVVALTGCAAPPRTPPPAHPLNAKNIDATMATAMRAVHSVHARAIVMIGKKASTVDADVVLGGADGRTSLHATITTPGQPKAELVDTAAGLFVRGGGSGPTWTVLDPAAASAPASTIASLAAVASPTSLSPVTSSVAWVQVAGASKIMDGDRVTPYLVAIDTSAVATALGSLGAVATKGLPAQLNFDFWIGDDGLPRRVDMVTPAYGESLRFTHWGDPVHIDAPVVG